MHGTALHSIGELKEEFDQLRIGKDSLLRLLEEAELPESVYNSNAIENSTLTLDETEKILFRQELPSHHSKREIFEAINLGAVTQYLDEKIRKKHALNEELMFFIHKTLLSNINDEIAGRFRQKDEYVRVGPHIAPGPHHLPALMTDIVSEYHSAPGDPLDRIVLFHLAFEHIHPFRDGNGRVGRALLNFQLKSHGYPPIIIRNKEKQHYYEALRAYDKNQSVKEFEHAVTPLLKESFHKRIAYLRGDEIVLLSKLAKIHPERSPQSLANAAKQQSMPAFRERGRWKVGKKMFEEWLES
ncbi:MAG: Fic family protein [Candidatus Peribacteraceae bacterium]|nr:Fic family protein [Candidatus Peribacteraceae bacterium]